VEASSSDRQASHAIYPMIAAFRGATEIDTNPDTFASIIRWAAKANIKENSSSDFEYDFSLAHSRKVIP
jgi:hypothetical protein